MITLSQITPHFARGWQTRTDSANSVAITFDDGPDAATTPQLLKMLDDTGLKATMFVIGQKCRKQGSLLREITAAGHALACHGYVHARHGFRGKAYLETSLRQSTYMLDEFGVTVSRAFRPPYGFIDFGMPERTRNAGFTPVLWSAHINDWKPQSEAELLRACERVVHERMILLLHDGHVSTSRLKPTLEYLASVIRARKWAMLKLPEHQHAGSAIQC